VVASSVVVALTKFSTPMNTDTDTTTRKVTAMFEWANVLTQSAHDALERMDTRLTLAEAKVAMVREMIAQRHALCISYQA
jgi:hypothetical protein